MTESSSRANDEESVADVSIDTVYSEEQQPASAPQASGEGEFVLSFAQPESSREEPRPEGHAANTPPRAGQSHERTGVGRGSRTASRPGQGKKKRKGVQKRPPESLPRKILLAPVRLVNRVSAWVMGSGIDHRNPLLVTIRLLAVLLPMFFSIYLSYLQMAAMRPGSGNFFKDKNESGVVVGDSRNPVIRVGAKKLTIPLPDEFEIMDTEEYFRRYPLSKRVAELDGFHVILAARRTDSENSPFYLNVGVTGDHAAQNFGEKNFAKMLRDLMRIREAGSMVQNGPNQTDIPFEVTARSACFGRLAGKVEYKGKIPVTKEALRQYSCILYMDGKAVTINVGFAHYPEKSDGGDSTWCRNTLTRWRDELLDKYK